MNVSKALLTRRTIRKFSQKPVAMKKLKTLVNYARLAPFAANIQALRYKIIREEKMRDRIFNNVKWAGYLKNGSPAKDMRPMAYIAVLGDTTVKKEFETDAGAAITSILLGAHDLGLGACWLGSINHKEISKILEIPEQYSLLYIVALGYPAEASKDCGSRNGIKYFYDKDGILNVPKLPLEDIII